MKTALRSIVLGMLMATGLFFAPAATQADTYSPSAYGSDYYMYFQWDGCYNACVSFPWQRLTIYEANLGAVLYTIDNMAAYQGKNYPYAAGPNQGVLYFFRTEYFGWFCDYYGNGEYITAGTAALRAPGALTATDDAYDTCVVLNWGASSTDVPANLYQYAIYRDGVWKATVSSSTLSWTDYTPVPGSTYKYEVATYSATSTWTEYSTGRPTTAGRLT